MLTSNLFDMHIGPCGADDGVIALSCGWHERRVRLEWRAIQAPFRAVRRIPLGPRGACRYSRAIANPAKLFR
jgi:hypothetical protein